MSGSFQGAPGAMLSASSAVSPLLCPAEAVPAGAAAVSPQGNQQPTALCSLVDSTGEVHFERGGGSLSSTLQGEGKG